MADKEDPRPLRKCKTIANARNKPKHFARLQEAFPGTLANPYKRVDIPSGARAP